jgi:O-antigen/teichoic acid export membrane protein
VLGSEWASLYVRSNSRRAVAPGFWHAQRLILSGAAVLTVLAIVVVAVAGPSAARLLGLPSGSQFTVVLCLYLLGLPAAFFVEVSGRLITTLRVNQVLPWLSGFALVVNLLLDLLGRSLLGLAGIAAATTVVRVAAAAIMAWWVRRSFAHEPAPVP